MDTNGDGGAHLPARPSRAPTELGLLAVSLAVALGAFVIAAARGWPGTALDCRFDACFCEAEHPGWLRQPANTLSNVVPIVLALVSALRAHRSPAPTAASRAFDHAFPIALGFQGTGSMFFHASLVEWAAAVDAVSMVFVMGLFVSANVARYRAQTGGPAARSLLVRWAALVATGLSTAIVSTRAISALMFVLLLTTLSFEVASSRRHGPLGREPWLRFGLAAFLVANGVWSLAAVPTMPLCAPSSLLQGHAFWHAAAALAVFSFGVHVRRGLAART